MDEDRIGLVLAKTSELRSKIVNCIHKAASNVDKEGKQIESESSLDNNEEEEEEESLLNIKEALESLEAQLSSLQALQQQQWYEKESSLAEIQYSQKKLIKNLKEYKGKDLEIIHEAIAFAGDTEDNNDLLLPPYPNPTSQPLLSENGYRHSFQSTQKSQNGFIKDTQESEINTRQSGLWGTFERLKGLFGVVAKTAVTIVGIMTVLSLAGLEPKLRKRDNQFKLFDLMKIEKNTIDCPPGKIPLIENGEMRCVVKERVETPFEPVIATPDVSYGCG